MSITRDIPIEDATEAQLRAAAESYGLEIEHTDGADALRAKLNDVHTGPTIEVSDDAPKRRGRPPKSKAEAGAKPDLVNLTVAIGDENGGHRDVFTSVNGRAMMIPRGKPVDVPRPYYESLASAKKIVYQVDQVGRISKPREVSRFPHTVHSGG